LCPAHETSVPHCNRLFMVFFLPPQDFFEMVFGFVQYSRVPTVPFISRPLPLTFMFYMSPFCLSRSRLPPLRNELLKGLCFFTPPTAPHRPGLSPLLSTFNVPLFKLEMLCSLGRRLLLSHSQSRSESFFSACVSSAKSSAFAPFFLEGRNPASKILKLYFPALPLNGITSRSP